MLHEFAVKIPPSRAGLVALMAPMMILFMATKSQGAGQNVSIRSLQTVISHVTVIDVATGRELRDRTIVIDGDRIRAVRASTPADIQAEGRHIDGRGKYLIPGLWDMHVHGNNDAWYAEWFPLYIANGVTGIREMFGPPQADRFRNDIVARHIDAPHIYLASPIVDGDPPAWPDSLVVGTAQQARRVVDEQKAGGADFIKVYNNLSREAYFAVLDEAKLEHISVAGHVPFSVTVQEASAAGQVSLEHLYGFPTACSSNAVELQARRATASTRADRHAVVLEAVRTLNDSKCRRVFSLLKRNLTWQVPTLAVFNADFVSNADPAHTDARLQYFSGDGLKWLRGDYSAYPEMNSESETAYRRELFEFMIKVTGAMFRTGVPMLAGTDTGNAYVFPGFSLHEELALMVQAGATPLQALRSATRNPAVFMHSTDRFGAIAARKVADLVLLDADPLADIHNTSKISAVFLAGKLFDRATLDQLLNQAKAATAAYK
jgi:imidazolonepropionase-like amidohydrolase